MGSLVRVCLVVLCGLAILANCSAQQSGANGNAKQQNGANLKTLLGILNGEQVTGAGQSAASFGKLISLFTNSSLPQEISNFFQALSKNFSDLSTADKVGEVISAVSSSGLNFNDVEELFNTTGFSLSEFLEEARTNGLPTGVQLALQGVAAQLSSVVSSYGISYQCQQHLGVIVNGIVNRLPWALQMLDAMGKPGSMILEGHVAWIGSYDECLKVEAVTYSNYTTLEDPVRHFGGRYCGFMTAPPSALTGGGEAAEMIQLVLGLCVADSCSQSDVYGMIKAGASLFMENVTDFTPTVYCKVQERTLSTEAIVAICVLAILGTLIVFGTLYDLVAVQSEGSKNKYSPAVSIPMVGKTNLAYDGQENGTSNPELAKSANGGPDPPEWEQKKYPDGQTPDTTTKASVDMTVVDTKQVAHAQTQSNRSALENCLLAFSAYSNTMKIMNTKQAAGSLGSVNGIRFLSMAWVILGHTIYFAMGESDNIYQYYGAKIQQWTFMGILSASVSVDTFFALSGLLVAYLSLREMKKVGGVLKFKWGMYYFHRFWRLTPPYMLLLMVYVTLIRYFSHGPIWHDDADSGEYKVCRENWWTNLLYINNLVHNREMCMGWTWYLANDMQFYVLSPILIIPLFYNKIAGALVSLLFLAATTVTPGLIAKEHRYPVQQVPGAPVATDKDYGIYLYIAPYSRMAPYVIGMVTGYVLYKTKCKCNIPKPLNLLGWLITAGILTSCIYGVYDNHGKNIWTLDETVVYHATARMAWGMAVCWVVFACATGHGGLINQLLSWKAFVPLGRLTYCAYLVHPIVMNVYYESRRTLVYFTDFETAYLFMGHMVASYGVAFIVSLAFESPMMGLEKAIFRRDKRS